MMIERINNGSISFIGTHKRGQLQKNNVAGSRSLLDSLTNVSKQRLTFYEANKNNPNLLRDTVNFFDGSVTYGKGSNGFFYMGNDGKGQAIPQNAVSRIDVGSLAKLSAKANTICLSSKSYYAYKGIDGKEYACAFNGKTVCRARSEWVLGRCKENTTPECRGAMVLTMHVLSGLANGSTGVLHMDGLEAARWLRENGSKACIVFLTGYPEYSLEGYKVDAHRYLLKNAENIKEALYECLSSALEKMQKDEKKIDLAVQGGILSIAPSKIVYAESKVHRVTIHVLENSGDMQEYYMYDRLDHVQETLAHFGFMRIHQSYLINREYLKTICRYKAELIAGISLGISKKYYKDLEDYYIRMRGEF